MGSGLLTPGHLIIVAIIALLVFGPKRLPELGRSLGSGMRSFKHAIEGDDEDEQPAAAVDPPKADPVAEPKPAPVAAESGAVTPGSRTPVAAPAAAPAADAPRTPADPGT